MYRYFWNIYSANILPWSLHHLSQVCSTKQLFLQNSEKYINMAKYHLGKVGPCWVFLSTVCVTCGVHVALRGFAGLMFHWTTCAVQLAELCRSFAPLMLVNLGRFLLPLLPPSFLVCTFLHKYSFSQVICTGFFQFDSAVSTRFYGRFPLLWLPWIPL